MLYRLFNSWCPWDVSLIRLFRSCLVKRSFKVEGTTVNPQGKLHRLVSPLMSKGMSPPNAETIATEAHIKGHSVLF